MIKIEISEGVIERAKDLYTFKNLNRSISKGRSQLYGAIGEIIVYDYFKQKGYKINHKSTSDYDMIINGFKIDVKTKRIKAEPPQLKWRFPVPAYYKQKCDYYFFVMVHDSQKRGWLLGYKRTDNFFKEASFNKKGSLDEECNIVFHFKADCYNLHISKMNKFA